MTTMPQPTEIDLVIQVYTTFEELQRTNPTPERAEVLELLRPLRNMVAHGGDPDEYPGDAVEWMRTNMNTLIQGSLGTPGARALRLRSDPAVIAGILARSDAAATPRPRRRQDTAKARGTRRAYTVRARMIDPPAEVLAPTTEELITLVAETEGRSSTPDLTLTYTEAFTKTNLDKLVTAAATGDRTARDRCFVIFMPMVLRYCRARMGDLDVAEIPPDDVAQEVCIAAFKALPRYQDAAGAFAHLLYATAANKVADVYRADTTTTCTWRDSEPDQPMDLRMSIVVPEGLSDAEKLKYRMARLLAMLPYIQREVITLRISVGLSAGDTAIALNISPQHVKVLQHRALARLREVMAANPDL